MQLIIDEIREITQVLTGLRSDNIVIENLSGIIARLKTSDVDHKMARYSMSQPSSPGDEQSMEKHKALMKDQADALNKEADHFLDELERIKKIRQTLNLEALDPIIKEAKRIIHSIHRFTAGLQEEE